MRNRVPEGFDAFFVDAYPGVYRAALRVLGSREEAEDVASDAMARALVKWGNVQKLPYREAWVRRVAINRSIDVLRARGRGEMTTALATAGHDGEAGQVPFDDDLRVLLSCALAKLSRRQSHALALKYLYDLSDEEVAAQMGVSKNSVRTHIRRGLIALRASVGASEEEIRNAFAP